jgi:hypothetical protein
MDARGRYELRVDRDRSATAALRAEDAPAVAALCAAAPSLTVGGRALGTFLSQPGGVRAACGLTGGDTVVKLTVAKRARVRLRAAAHFEPAFELRRGCTEPALACARAADGEHEVELERALDPGEYFVVLDSTRIAPRSRYNDAWDGAGVAGAWLLDATAVSP